MKDNVHQFKDMEKLARSLSPDWRIGDQLAVSFGLGRSEEERRDQGPKAFPRGARRPGKARILRTRNLLSPRRRSYLFLLHRSPARFPHRSVRSRCPSATRSRTRIFVTTSGKGASSEAGTNSSPEYRKGYGAGGNTWRAAASCGLRKDCSWCPAYGYLEHGRFPAKVDLSLRVGRRKGKIKGGLQDGKTAGIIRLAASRSGSIPTCR